MRDEDCVGFLQWCLPRLRLRWPGYRKVRRTVCKRLGRRLRALGLLDLDGYRAFLEDHPAEWQRVDAFCRIPISRFWRDRAVFGVLAREVLPVLAEQARARGDSELRAWCAGCASGEEVYSLRLAWDELVQSAVSTPAFAILGTDAEETMLERAKTACYGRGTLKELPAEWLDRAFVRSGELFCLRPERRQGVSFRLQDIRSALPDGPFDLILCRNLAFTYFEAGLQTAVLGRIGRRLRDGGALVVGSHERLPDGAAGWTQLRANLPVYLVSAAERREGRPRRSNR
jgi:chemotaxis protein methyltransferase CheR